MRNSQNKWMKILLMVALMAAPLVGCGTKDASKGIDQKKSSEQVKATKTIEDMAGNKVQVPEKVDKAAPLVMPSFEKIILLKAIDKTTITGANMASKGWAKVVAPEYAKKTFAKTAFDPNIEELVKSQTQVVFFWDTYPEVTKKMEEAHIPVAVVQMGKQKINSVDEFVKLQKAEVKTMADIFGKEQQDIYKKWSKYYEEKVKYVTNKTDKLKDNERPKVYYVRGPEALKTHGGASYTRWLVEAAGGNMVTKDIDDLLFETTMENVIKWNPEYIFMGRVGDNKVIMDDPAWKEIKAVKDKKVIIDPAGIAPIDYSSENILLMLHIAKTLHPNLFKDLDIKKEVKAYFKEFYGYDMTDEQVKLYLEHKNPDGSIKK